MYLLSVLGLEQNVLVHNQSLIRYNYTIQQTTYNGVMEPLNISGEVVLEIEVFFYHCSPLACMCSKG